MNSAIGVAGVVNTSSQFNLGVTTSVLSIVGSGRVKQLSVIRGVGAPGELQAYIRFDSGTALYGVDSWSNATKYLGLIATTDSAFKFTSTVQDIDLYFKSSLDIYLMCPAATQTANYIIIYEKN